MKIMDMKLLNTMNKRINMMLNSQSILMNLIWRIFTTTKMAKIIMRNIKKMK